MPDFPYPDAAAVAIGMTGKTTAKYLCPCSDEETGFQGQSFWVELTGPGGWPSLLSGRCLRCGESFSEASDVHLAGFCAWEMRGVRLHLVTEHLRRFYMEPSVANKVCSSSNYNF